VIADTFLCWLTLTTTPGFSLPSMNCAAFERTVFVAAVSSPLSSRISIAVARLRAVSLSRRSRKSWPRNLMKFSWLARRRAFLIR
jgi:hypothetical protein